MLVFSYYPPINSLILSFTDSTNGLDGEFIGFDNYKELFFGGPNLYDRYLSNTVFWKSLLNVIILTVVGMITGNAMTIFLAELLYNCKAKILSKIYRYLFIITILVPGVVNTLIWETLVFSANGLANTILKAFNQDPSLWYFSPDFMAMLAIMLTGFPWVGGTSFLIYLAGLQNIPESIKEAGILDGLTTFKRIVYIDFPYLAGQLKYFLILGIIGGLQNFSLQLIVMGAGYGSSNATVVPGFLLYDLSIEGDRYGLAAAIGMVIFVLTLGLTILNMKRMKTTEDMTA